MNNIQRSTFKKSSVEETARQLLNFVATMYLTTGVAPEWFTECYSAYWIKDIDEDDLPNFEGFTAEEMAALRAGGIDTAIAVEKEMVQA